MMATSILKKLGLSSAALCAALLFAQPQSATAQDRYDYRDGNGYGNNYVYRDSREAREYQEHLTRERREREWREHERRERSLQWRRNHDRDAYRYADPYYR